MRKAEQSAGLAGLRQINKQTQVKHIAEYSRRRLNRLASDDLQGEHRLHVPAVNEYLRGLSQLRTRVCFPWNHERRVEPEKPLPEIHLRQKPHRGRVKIKQEVPFFLPPSM
jgi:hypothetical protein